MQKILLVLSSIIIMTSSAFSKDMQSSYVSAGLSYLAVPEGMTGGLGLSLKAGVDADYLFENLGSEIEIQKSVLNPEYSNSFDANILTMSIYVTYDIKIPDSEVAIRPRFGMVLPNLGDDNSVNSRDIGFSSGLDVTYKLEENLVVYGGYTNLGEMINSYLIGVEFHF